VSSSGHPAAVEAAIGLGLENRASASACERFSAGDSEDRNPTHGYAATREAAMAAFAKSWRRE
jgi:hypothetical protein